MAEGDEFADFVGRSACRSTSNASATSCWWAAVWAWRRCSRSCAPRRPATAPPASSASAMRERIFWRDKLAEWERRVHSLHRRRQRRPPWLCQRGARRRDRARAPDLVVAIGPMPMMMMPAETTRPHGVRTMVRSTPSWSTAPACAAPAVTVGGRSVRLRRRPFDAHQVDFPELLARGQKRASRRRRARTRPTSAARELLLVVQAQRLRSILAKSSARR